MPNVKKENNQMYKIFFVVFLLHLSGCSTLNTRIQDSKDIFDLSVQKGIGINAHASLFGYDLGYNITTVGLENGYFHPLNSFEDLSLVSHYNLHTPYECGFLLVNAHGDHSNDFTIARNKDYGNWNLLGFLPSGPDGRPEFHLSYLTRFTLSASLGYGLKFGFNPGELLDFILGFLKIDIYKDDNVNISQSTVDKEQSNK